MFLFKHSNSIQIPLSLSYSYFHFDPKPSHCFPFSLSLCLCERTFFLLGSFGGLDFLPNIGSFQNRLICLLFFCQFVVFSLGILYLLIGHALQRSNELLKAEAHIFLLGFLISTCQQLQGVELPLHSAVADRLVITLFDCSSVISWLVMFIVDICCFSFCWEWFLLMGNEPDSCLLLH